MIKRLSLLFESEKGAQIYRNALEIIREHSMEEMMSKGVLVGFSGGPDSVMLLCVLKKLQLDNKLNKICALHVNHMIRGEEADRDEQFSRDFCNSLDIEFCSVKRDVPAEAKLLSKGVEETAREIRYSVFKEIISSRNDLFCVAVAHNSTDNFETIFLNMMRGAGTKGMSGIPPLRDEIIRPLLYSSKRDILEALQSAGIPFVIDSTNNECEYRRNFIRNEILPKFYRLSEDPEIMATRVSKNLRADADYIEKQASDFLNSFDGTDIPSCEIAKLHFALASRVISFMALRGGASGIESTHISKIFKLLISTSSFEVSLPGQVSFICRGGICNVFRPEFGENEKFDFKLSMGINYIPELDIYIYLSEKPIESNYSNVYKISIQKSIDFDIINGDVHVRNKRDGDSYVFGGMTRKLKKLFNDRSIPPHKRSRIPVFYDENGILWVEGFSIRDGGSKSPQNHLYISILKKQG